MATTTTTTTEIIKILITDPVDDVCYKILKSNGILVDQIKLTKEQLLDCIKEYDGLIVRSETKVTADIINAGTKLKIVGRAGTGVDNVDCVTATQKGVLVMNTPGGNTLSAAEHTCALIASMARNIPQGVASLKTGAWDRKLFSGNELYGKTLAILGLGRIGKEVALRMQSYGMKTIGYDPIIPGDVTIQFGVESMALDEIWPKADFITVHVPLIPETKNLINDEIFQKCKKGVRVVNVARGGIIDEESLLRNLKSGQCGGAGLDVFVQEPPKADYYKELLGHPKMVCTPHLGASTSEAQLRVAEEIGEQFVSFFNGTSLVGAVNAGNLPIAMSGVNKPWVTIGKNLGLVCSLFGNNATSINITVHDSTLKDTSFIPSAVVSGYLSGILNNKNINMINAPSIAKEKGINLNINKSSTSKVEKTLVIDIKIGNEIFHINGTLHGDVTILNNIDNHYFQGLVLNGTILFYNGTSKQSDSNLSSLFDILKNKNIIPISLHQSTKGEAAVTNEKQLLIAKINKQDIDLATVESGIKYIGKLHF